MLAKTAEVHVMFKSRVTKICLLAVLVISLVAILMVFCFATGDKSPAGQPRRDPRARRVLSPTVDQLAAGRVPIGHDRMDPSSDQDDEFPAEVVADDSIDEIVELDLSDIPGADILELCRRLEATIRSGESPETIAVSAELVKRGDDSVADVKRLLNSGNRSVETAAMRILVRIGTAKSVGTAALPKLLVEPYGDSRNNLLKVFGNVRSLAISDIVVDLMLRGGKRRKEGGFAKRF